LFRYHHLTTALATILVLSFASAAKAQTPPREGCRAASKIEYDSAKRHFLLRSRVGAYLKTGHFWRHYYWYCHLS
jgi:hypothetical protein